MKRLVYFFCLLICLLSIPVYALGPGIFLTAANSTFTFNAIATAGHLTFGGQFRTVAGSSITVVWGDGSSNNVYTGTGQVYTHTYSGPGTYAVIVSNASAMTQFTMTTGSANIAFNIATVPSSVLYLYIAGNNTVSGTIPATVYLSVTGNNTISGYSSVAWPSNMQYVCTIPVSGGISGVAGSCGTNSCIDQIFIDLDAAGGTWTGNKTITLTGTNGAPTAASAAARTDLTSVKGVAITHN